MMVSPDPLGRTTIHPPDRDNAPKASATVEICIGGHRWACNVEVDKDVSSDRELRLHAELAALELLAISLSEAIIPEQTKSLPCKAEQIR